MGSNRAYPRILGITKLGTKIRIFIHKILRWLIKRNAKHLPDTEISK